MNIKINRIIALLIVICIFGINTVIAETSGYFSGGDGTADNPYRIMTKGQLCNISLFPDVHYILMRDLEFTEADYADGGICAGGWNSPDEFTGSFDGMGNTISNLVGNDGGFVNINSGTIDSVVFKNHKLVSKTGTENFGAVADENKGTITRCYVNLSLSEDTSPVAKCSGGIAGYNSGEISYSYINGNLYVRGPEYDYCFIYTGGFAGKSSGRITNCYNDAYIYVKSPYVTEYVYIGGICGVGDVYNCRNDGSMYIDARMDYDIYASPFGSHPSYSSYYCYGNLNCGSSDSYKLNRYNTHKNINCYTDAQENPDAFETNFKNLDFDKDWMITAEGPIPQGIVDPDGNCWSKQSYIAPKCEEKGEFVFVNQYGETLSGEFEAVGHMPNELGEGCLRDGCSENVITSITMNLPEASIKEGESVQLSATYLPENATDKTLIWSTTDETVAVVDQTGMVTGQNAGTATITVTAVGGKSAECNIVVEPKDVLMETVYVESYGIRTYIGDTFQLNYWVSPENTTSHLVWTSSDEAIATVNNEGFVTVNGYGDVTITATSSDGMCYSDAYITIMAPMFLNANNIILNTGDTFKLEYVSSYEIDEKPYYYFDENIAKFGEDGTVTAVSCGTVYDWDMNTGESFEIQVTDGYSGYTVRGTYTILAGEEYPLPVTGVESGYLWGYSNDDAIVKYDSETQTIKGISEGTCGIYTDIGTLEVRVIEPYGGSSVYTVEDGIITKYEGTAENLVIPSEIDGETIVGIGDKAFDAEFKSVTIPGTVKNIGDSAFYYCNHLESVVMEEGVESIGEYAFSGLSRLNYLELPASLKTIGENAFWNDTPEDIIYNGSKSDWINLNILSYNDCLEVLSGIYGEISTENDLYMIAEAVNSKKTSHNHKSFTLKNNISLGNKEWTPIGIYDDENAFRGNFDGNGYTISDFRITTPRKYNGFFGNIYGEVRELDIKNAVIDLTGIENVQWCWSGLLAGWSYYGNITDCSSDGVINLTGSTNDDNVGGLIGRVSSATVSQCSSNVKINIVDNRQCSVGGLVGYIYGTIDESNSYAEITYKGGEYSEVGGICGYQATDSTQITDSVSRGNINAIINGEKNLSWIGGVIGCNEKVAENNKSYMDIVYSSENDIYAGQTVGGHRWYSWTENNNVGYGNLYRAPYVKLSVTQDNDSGYICEYEIIAPELNGDAIFVSLYSKNKLIKSIRVTKNSEEGTIYLSERPDTYKVFVWKDLNSFTPIHSFLYDKI